ncbi:MAG TPA: glycosyltransferase [Myxococcales bacterium]|nr:glycosyltransferase [Myxococcales bacterium]HIN85770.1 glycosyltransferase [Myxococcales bacterium]
MLSGSLATFDFVLLLVYAILLVFLSIYGLHRYFLAYLYYKHKNDGQEPKKQWEDLPLVTIQLPTFNEMYVVERLINATCGIRYPSDKLQIQVLDDSTDETTEIARQCVKKWTEKGMNIELMHRSNRMGYKAGALEAGTESAHGEFMVVFDADFVPQPDFLESTIHYFTDTSIGMVQVRWAHINRNFSMLTRAQSVLLDGHFIIEHTARNRSGRFFNFNGTAGIWRRSTISDAGGWQHDTLTEDLDLSYRAQIKGWNFVFLPEVLSPAELPVEMNSFKSQQHRWAKGSIQTAKKLLPILLKSDLPAKVKLESFFHLTNNLAYLMMVALCLIMPLSIAVRYELHVPALMLIDLPAFLLATVSICYFYYVCQREAGISKWVAIRSLPVVLSIGIGLCINNTRAVLEALVGYETGFTRTPKYAVTDANDEAWKKRKNYHRKKDWMPLVELSLGIYFTYAVYAAISYGAWAAFPFMVLFQFGFLYMASLSLIQTRTGFGKTLDA